MIGTVIATVEYILFIDKNEKNNSFSAVDIFVID
ncbi:hypothetical protein EMA8858_01016 [Emticicia aquatica]|uniref:Uncharacterized protein n=1 Tax=Emticicia aquatica TaxID=1681835 RepID=A0ABN8EPU1_9BACT|nr:hypothetical protein EMA8858_01016 [Emticicia aquatica]